MTKEERDRRPDPSQDHPREVELLGGNEIRAWLARYDLAPTKRRGQNFVTDPNTVQRIVRDAGVSPGDVVVEVGPGLGSLTLALVAAGAHVVAVELDHGLAAALRGIIDDRGVADHVDVLQGDAVGLSWADLLHSTGVPLDDPRPAMVANLPYNVATPILMTALEQDVFSFFHLMVQREVGERWVAHPGDPAFGAVSVKVALQATAALAGTVSRQAFHPAPRVDSVTVDVTVHNDTPRRVLTGVLALIDAGFAQRRKTLRNTLGAAGYDPKAVVAALTSVGLDTKIRAEALTPEKWLELAAVLLGEVS